MGVTEFPGTMVIAGLDPAQHAQGFAVNGGDRDAVELTGPAEQAEVALVVAAQGLDESGHQNALALVSEMAGTVQGDDGLAGAGGARDLGRPRAIPPWEKLPTNGPLRASARAQRRRRRRRGRQDENIAAGPLTPRQERRWAAGSAWLCRKGSWPQTETMSEGANRGFSAPG